MKEYLICIDSDGCAIDSMEIKHRRCFGPCMVDIWQLEPWREEILNRWNDINLYSMTRGINRFLGLEKILTEIDGSYKEIDGLESYSAWCRAASTFSNAAVEAEIRAGNHPIFSKVLEWSEYVNRSIAEIAPEVGPFPGVKEALEAMRSRADIAIVSSANPQAVREEWGRFGFLEYVDYVMAQDAGTKADCIAALRKKGYDPEKILMLGDAPGDRKAAEQNGVLYYPILAGQEAASWQRLINEALPRLFSGSYDPDYRQGLLDSFLRNLGGQS